MFDLGGEAAVFQNYFFGAVRSTNLLKVQKLINHSKIEQKHFRFIIER